MKDNLGLKFPNLPYFIDGETKLTETNAIMKYICNKWNPDLLGVDPAQRAQVEMVASVVNDLKGAVTMPCYTQNDKEPIKVNLLQKVKPIVDYLGDKPFLCGDNICYVDFTMFELCELMQFISDGTLFATYNKL